MTFSLTRRLQTIAKSQYWFITFIIVIKTLTSKERERESLLYTVGLTSGSFEEINYILLIFPVTAWSLFQRETFTNVRLYSLSESSEMFRKNALYSGTDRSRPASGVWSHLWIQIWQRRAKNMPNLRGYLCFDKDTCALIKK